MVWAHLNEMHNWCCNPLNKFLNGFANLSQNLVWALATKCQCWDWAQQLFHLAAETVVRAVLQAIELGFKHFDTASVYQTEPTLGEAIEEAIRLGLVKSRDELFITSKLWCSDSHAQLVLKIIVVMAVSSTSKHFKTHYYVVFLKTVFAPTRWCHGLQ